MYQEILYRQKKYNEQKTRMAHFGNMDITQTCVDFPVKISMFLLGTMTLMEWTLSIKNNTWTDERIKWNWQL